MNTALAFRLAFAANATTDSFTNKIPTLTAPTGVGVFDLLDPAVGLGAEPYIPTRLMLAPFGSDADNEAFDLRLWGWSKIKVSAGPTFVWVPQLLVQLAVTLGNIDAAALFASNFMADTIAVTDGASGSDEYGASIISTVLDTASTVLVGLRGCERIEFAVDIGTAASGNCLWRAVDDG